MGSYCQTISFRHRKVLLYGINVESVGDTDVFDDVIDRGNDEGDGVFEVLSL